jgi:hypothetical protein
MKYRLFLPVLLLSLAACDNPSLKWIGAPEDSDAGFSEVFFKVEDPNLLPSRPSSTYQAGVVEIKVNLNSPGTGSPYSAPQWRLDGDSCAAPFGDIAAGFNGKPYLVSVDNKTIWIDTNSLDLVTHEVLVTVTGVDGKSYTDKVTVLVE